MIHGSLVLEINFSLETRAFLTGLVDQLARALVVDRHTVEARIRAELSEQPLTHAARIEAAGPGPAATPVARQVGPAEQAAVRDVSPRAAAAPIAAPATISPAASPIAAASPGGNARPAGDEPALLDVSSPPSPAPAAVPPAGLGDGTQAPAAMTKPAGASFPPMAKPVLWSPERDQVLRDGYPAGESNRQLLDKVNALPGREAVLAQIVPRCMYLKLRRAPSVVSPAGRLPTDPASIAPVTSIASGDEEVVEPLERTATEIMQWCGFAKYKFTGRLDDARLADINAFRHGKGLPPYKLISAPPPPPPQKPHRASYKTILHWANQRGLCMDGNLDLAVVNAKAVQLGLAPFELEEPPRRAVASIIRHHQNQGDS